MAQRDEIRELRAEIRRLKERVQMRPIITKEGGGAGGQVSMSWIRVDGGQTLRASPLVTGIKWGTTDPATVPDNLDAGTCNTATGVETVAPTGTFPDRTGYGTLATQISGRAVTFTRVLLKYANGGANEPVLVAGWVYWNIGSTVTIPTVSDPLVLKTFYLVGW